jgi:hypothetical protein
MRPTRIENAPLWAITSYFNPAGFQSRRANYLRFRDELGVPLVTAELSLDGHFELGPEDADILVQHRGSATLWHKESLLNSAFAALPPSVPTVAWVDCDVLFADKDWAKDAVLALKRHRIVQLFSGLCDLTDRESEQGGPVASEARHRVSGRGIASLIAADSLPSSSFTPRNTLDMRSSSFGIAWAANAEVLRLHSFYDAMIIGSGDRAMACAAYGNYAAAIDALCLSGERASHYLSWARPFHDSINGDVGFLPGTIYHLWHGEIPDRSYKERHRALAELDFRLDRDLERDVNGFWRWRRPRPDMEDFFRRYFQGRREDGTKSEKKGFDRNQSPV